MPRVDYGWSLRRRRRQPWDSERKKTLSTNNKTSERTRPNIIVILVDDMGFSDIGCYGSEINTPNLDTLAESGLRFTNMYNCARCCPTRAALLTGLYPHQAGVGHMVNDRGVGRAYQGYLRDDCVTMAEALKEAGYRTYMSGKWHVGGAYTPNRPSTWTPGDATHPLPVQRGFDQHYGMLGGAGSYFYPPYMVRNDQLIYPREKGYYITDAISNNAVSMIEDAAREDSPFFLYVAYTAPHWPLHALPEDIERYRGRYRKGGWDQLRDQRHERQKSMGLLEPGWELSPRDKRAPAWDDVAEKEWQDLRMAVYAAQIDRMDQGVGRILAKLRQLDLEEDTLVMFLSDNGGCAESIPQSSSFRYNIPTPDGRAIRVGNTPEIDPGPEDTFCSYGLPWANASNTPFRYYKKWTHEGGVATPLVVSWPRMIAEPRLVHSPCHVIDIMATCLDAAQAKAPRERLGRAVPQLEGESFLPLLQGRDWSRERPIFWEHEGNRAVRHGMWKLVSERGGPWELYNMENDRTELNDVADQEKARVKRMIRWYEDWAAHCEVREDLHNR